MKNNSILEYKGYHTKIEYDSVDKILHGKIEGINDLVTFESRDINTIEDEFHKAVEDYLVMCEDLGQQPEKEYKGSFNIRIAPELHKKLVLISYENSESLNSCIERALRSFVERESVT